MYGGSRCKVKTVPSLVPRGHCYFNEGMYKDFFFFFAKIYKDLTEIILSSLQLINEFTFRRANKDPWSTIPIITRKKLISSILLIERSNRGN